jgi:glycosyltransferase involved in cell wall biosynthesis
MRILFVVPYAPSLVRVRPYQLIGALARRGHDVTLAALRTFGDDTNGLRSLQARGINVVASDLPRWRAVANCLRAVREDLPMQALYCWAPALAGTIGQSVRASAFDVIHVEHVRAAVYGTLALGIRASLGRVAGPAVVWDSVDCISHLFAQAAVRSRGLKSRLMARLELARTRRYEGAAVGLFDHTLVTSAVDRQALLSLAGQRQPKPITVLTNGVDLSYFTPAPEAERTPDTLVFSGKMSYHANVTAVLYLAEQVMPRVWRRRPNVQLTVVGQDPPREIRALSSTHAAVRVIGRVEDIRPYLGQAAVAVAPMRYGAGIQNKVLEAMACATPVLATPPAVAGIAAQPGRDFLLADGPAEFADTILQLLDDPACRRQLGEAGRAYVEVRHSWDAVGARLEEVYARAIASLTQAGP